MGNKKTKQTYEEIVLNLDDRFREVIFNDEDDPEQVNNFIKKFKYKVLEIFEKEKDLSLKLYQEKKIKILKYLLNNYNLAQFNFAFIKEIVKDEQEEIFKLIIAKFSLYYYSKLTKSIFQTAVLSNNLYLATLIKFQSNPSLNQDFKMTIYAKFCKKYSGFNRQQSHLDMIAFLKL